MGTKYPEADVHSLCYSGSTFPDLDRFNRVTKSEWMKDYGTGTVKFFDTDVSYDRNSNIELVEDNVHGGRCNRLAFYWCGNNGNNCPENL